MSAYNSGPKHYDYPVDSYGYEEMSTPYKPYINKPYSHTANKNSGIDDMHFYEPSHKNSCCHSNHHDYDDFYEEQRHRHRPRREDYYDREPAGEDWDEQCNRYFHMLQEEISIHKQKSREESIRHHQYVQQESQYHQRQLKKVQSMLEYLVGHLPHPNQPVARRRSFHDLQQFNEEPRRASPLSESERNVLSASPDNVESSNPNPQTSHTPFTASADASHVTDERPPAPAPAPKPVPAPIDTRTDKRADTATDKSRLADPFLPSSPITPSPIETPRSKQSAARRRATWDPASFHYPPPPDPWFAPPPPPMIYNGLSPYLVNAIDLIHLHEPPVGAIPKTQCTTPFVQEIVDDDVEHVGTTPHLQEIVDDEVSPGIQARKPTPGPSFHQRAQTLPFTTPVTVAMSTMALPVTPPVPPITVSIPPFSPGFAAMPTMDLYSGMAQAAMSKNTTTAGLQPSAVHRLTPTPAVPQKPVDTAAYPGTGPTTDVTAQDMQPAASLSKSKKFSTPFKKLFSKLKDHNATNANKESQPAPPAEASTILPPSIQWCYGLPVGNNTMKWGAFENSKNITILDDLLERLMKPNPVQLKREKKLQGNIIIYRNETMPQGFRALYYPNLLGQPFDLAIKRTQPTFT